MRLAGESLLSCLPGACPGAVNMVEVEPDMVSAASVRGPSGHAAGRAVVCMGDDLSVP